MVYELLLMKLEIKNVLNFSGLPVTYHWQWHMHFKGFISNDLIDVRILQQEKN